MLAVLQFDPARTLQPGSFVTQEFVEPLRPVHPIISTFEFRQEQRSIIPGIHREARQAETVIFGAGAAKNR
jgi:arginine/ornithine N-succinyltransferase beta subunit